MDKLGRGIVMMLIILVSGVIIGASLADSENSDIVVTDDSYGSAPIPDPNSGEYKMVPMIQSVYLQKF